MGGGGAEGSYWRQESESVMVVLGLSRRVVLRAGRESVLVVLGAGRESVLVVLGAGRESVLVVFGLGRRVVLGAGRRVSIGRVGGWKASQLWPYWGRSRRAILGVGEVYSVRDQAERSY